MRHFIFEDDYEINPEYSRPHKKYGLTAGIAALYILSKHKNNKKNSSSGSYGGKNFPVDRRQNCTAKMHYSYSKEAHAYQIKKYLQREGAGKDGQAPELYGTNIEEYTKNMDRKNFRIFLSPGNDKVNLETLAKTFINKLEVQTGHQFYWLAAEHYNTAHPHVHLLINGKDKEGQDIFFDKDVVKTMMRDISRDICTSLVGSRTDEEIRQDKIRQLESSRLIRFDKKIAEMLQDNILNIKKFPNNREIIQKRLEHLAKMGLCKYNNGKYCFEENWMDTLQTVSRYNTFLDARNKLQYTSKYNLVLMTGEQKEKSGVITQIYRMQEDSDAHAVILESVDGNAYYIPLFDKPKQIKTGDFITVTTKENQKGRLTPNFSKINRTDLEVICKNNNYKQGFAKEVQNLNSEKTHVNQYNGPEEL